MTCDRSTCSNVDRIGVVSPEIAIIPSTDEFIANLLHLKCKVVNLARRQMQKEITGLDESPMAIRVNPKIAGKTGGARTKNAPSQVSAISRSEKQVATDEVVVREPAKKSANVGTIPTNAQSVQRPNQSQDETETPTNSVLQRIKNLFSVSLPFYWIVVVIGVLGFTSLVVGVLLGAFICTNGRLPFFRTKSRVGPVVY